jgi:hypothetical protein
VALDKFRTIGISETNTLLRDLPGAEVIQASTPDDLESIVINQLDGSVDFVLIDAVHENEVQTQEFRILEPLVSENGIVVFHDVLSCELEPSLKVLESEFCGWNFEVCNRTTTGVAVGYRKNSPALHNYIRFWAHPSDDAINFDLLVRAQWADEQLASDVTQKLTFPSHPQL